jgi:hypothetical protein
MLDIHASDGQVALKAAGLFDAFLGLIHKGREASRVLDPCGVLLLAEPDDGTGGRPEVRRGELCRLLLDSLPRGTTPWDEKLTAVTSLGRGRHHLTFEDGTLRSVGPRGTDLVGTPTGSRLCLRSNHGPYRCGIAPPSGQHQNRPSIRRRHGEGLSPAMARMRDVTSDAATDVERLPELASNDSYAYAIFPSSPVLDFTTSTVRGAPGIRPPNQWRSAC